MIKLKKQISQIQGAFLRLQNIRRGSRISRIGRYLVTKFNTRYLIGLTLIFILPLGSLLNPALSQTNQDGDIALVASFNIASAVPRDISVKTKPSTQMPLEHFRITQGYHLFHQAIDLAAPLGTPIKPVASGKVEIISYNSFGLGNYVVIHHSYDFYSVYAHLSKINVKKNEQVEQEDIIGAVGSTGYSTGPHLHLETIVNDQKINPLTILPKAINSGI